MDIKKIDLKTIIIIGLGIALIISFFFGQRSKTDLHIDELKKIKQENVLLLKSNDSLKTVNSQLDKAIIIINNKLNENTLLLGEIQLKLDKLKKAKNEIPTYVNGLDANGVTNAISNYLEKRTKN